jgi:hypothetical protein
MHSKFAILRVALTIAGCAGTEAKSDMATSAVSLDMELLQASPRCLPIK